MRVAPENRTHKHKRKQRNTHAHRSKTGFHTFCICAHHAVACHFPDYVISHKPKSGFVVKPASGDETSCNVAIPNPRRNVLAGGPRAHQNTAQPTSCRRELGCATLQPTPGPSHKHFSERFSKIHVYHQDLHFVVYHKGFFFVGNATRCGFHLAPPISRTA